MDAHYFGNWRVSALRFKPGTGVPMTDENDERRADITSGTAEMHQEGQGVWDFGFYPAAQLVEVEAAARRGSLVEVRLMACFMEFFRDVETRSSSSTPVMCMICYQAFGGGILPGALATVGAAIPNIRHRFVSGVCSACCQRPNLKHQIYAQYKTLMPRLRGIDVREAGHA
jgi:hypothetical protein